jgi:hypothetical protein
MLRKVVGAFDLTLFLLTFDIAWQYMKCYSIFYYPLAEQLYKKIIEKLRCALFIIFNLWIELAVASVYVMLHSVDLCAKG